MNIDTQELIRAQIELETIPPELEKEPIHVLFNPSHYSLDRGAQVATVATLGMNKPIPQHAHGDARTLTMDLFFDTYELGIPVTDLTDQIYRLLDVTVRGRPRFCTFTWGGFRFPCLVERVGGRFTLFRPDGTPVRATLSVTFREFHPEDEQARENPAATGDYARTYTVRSGDSLSGISAKWYDDPADWRTLAVANGIDDPLRVPPGVPLTIPPRS